MTKTDFLIPKEMSYVEEDVRSSLTIFLKWHRNWEMDKNLHEFFDFIGQVVATVGIKMCPRWSEKQSSDKFPQIKDGDYEIKSSFFTIRSKNRNYLLSSASGAIICLNIGAFEKLSWFPKNYEWH